MDNGMRQSALKSFWGTLTRQPTLITRWVLYWCQWDYQHVCNLDKVCFSWPFNMKINQSYAMSTHLFIFTIFIKKKMSSLIIDISLIRSFQNAMESYKKQFHIHSSNSHIHSHNRNNWKHINFVSTVKTVPLSSKFHCFVNQNNLNSKC